jgi:O-antigen biosynthesis protein WbqV
MDRRRLLALTKKSAIILHDLIVTGLAFVAAFVLRFEGPQLDERLPRVIEIVPWLVAVAALVYWFFDLYRSKWRFASLPDLSNIVKAVSVLALGLLLLDYVLVSPQFYGGFFFGKVTIVLYWLLQVFALGGPRLAYRYFKDNRTRAAAEHDRAAPALIAGRSGEVETVLRALERHAIGRMRPVGILSPRAQDVGQWIRNVPVLGTLDDLERIAADHAERAAPVRRLIVTASALAPEASPEALVVRARRLGLVLSRMAALDEGLGTATLAPVDIEDLLLRPTVDIDRARLESFIRGKRIAVTGGGGSIGAEICARLVAFGAAELLVIEHAEPALHAALESLAAMDGATRIEGAIADIRDAGRTREVLARFRPDAVVHAAALKHVPYLERDWTEGVKTNVFGTRNVAEAALAAGARVFVLISTDKAIEPVSMLGVTKRLAEMVVQAMDAEERPRAEAAQRLIAVRFGNVLGSNGSVVPKFKAQIERGGPVTVTHPDMVRFFMTVREAADLVLTAASHADIDIRGAGSIAARQDAASVYVLKMGQPVRILDLAERMIRLQGFEPGVDIEIAFTGVRPGERLNEILFAREEPTVDTGIDGVMAARPVFADRARMERWLDRLAEAVARGDRAAAETIMGEAVPEFGVRAAPPQTPATPRPPVRVVSNRG